MLTFIIIFAIFFIWVAVEENERWSFYHWKYFIQGFFIHILFSFIVAWIVTALIFGSKELFFIFENML